MLRNSTWSLDVIDQGPGISEEDLPRVFDRFYRADTARSLPGSGLGLAIVRQVVITHGGTVSASSPPGGGTHIHIELPTVAEHEPGPDVPHAWPAVPLEPYLPDPETAESAWGPPPVTPDDTGTPATDPTPGAGRVSAGQDPAADAGLDDAVTPADTGTPANAGANAAPGPAPASSGAPGTPSHDTDDGSRAADERSPADVANPWPPATAR
jgi:hypothetical protein